MAEDIEMSCQCGAFTASISAAAYDTSNHGICYCADCQAFARHLGQDGRIFDAQGGTEVFQTETGYLTLESGAENLALLKLRPKGLYRWFAACCNTPLMNTVGEPKIAFVGILAANLNTPSDQLGPVRFRYKTEQALGPVSEPKGSIPGFVWRSLRLIIGARLSGRWTSSPLFDAETGHSVVAPITLTEEDRLRAYSSGSAQDSRET
ncbi:MAG: DUF6151 family protein [Pseudomonadota bacterium]